MKFFCSNLSCSNLLRLTHKVGLVFVFAFWILSQSALAHAQGFVPSFFDPNLRLEKPDMTGLTTIRFLSDDDYPPFHFIGADGELTGLNIDLARALCAELKLTCTIQPRRWDTLLQALEQKSGDAVIASISSTPALRNRFAFTESYYRTPARFVTAKPESGSVVTPKALAGRVIGVMAGSSHEEFLKLFFGASPRKTYSDPDTLRLALKRGEIGIIFGDAVALAFWLNGSEAAGCCGFLGGAYTESRFFGDGVGIALRKEDQRLRLALDYALAKLSRDGVFTTLYLKYFPIGFY